jgi:hypothetical protein
VQHVYCWHGLPAYWGGIMPGASGLGPAGQSGVLVYPKPSASIAEVEPSLLWSPAVLAGVCACACVVVKGGGLSVGRVQGVGGAHRVCTVPTGRSNVSK